MITEVNDEREDRKIYLCRLALGLSEEVRIGYKNRYGIGRAHLDHSVWTELVVEIRDPRLTHSNMSTFKLTRKGSIWHCDLIIVSDLDWLE